jgi:hypothetical protein
MALAGRVWELRRTGCSRVAAYCRETFHSEFRKGSHKMYRIIQIASASAREQGSDSGYRSLARVGRFSAVDRNEIRSR